MPVRSAVAAGIGSKRSSGSSAARSWAYSWLVSSVDRDLDLRRVGQPGEAVGEGGAERLGHAVQRQRGVVAGVAQIELGEEVETFDQRRPARAAADGVDLGLAVGRGEGRFDAGLVAGEVLAGKGSAVGGEVVGDGLPDRAVVHDARPVAGDGAQGARQILLPQQVGTVAAPG